MYGGPGDFPSDSSDHMPAPVETARLVILPKNLEEVMASDQIGWRLGHVMFLERTHCQLSGRFAAVFKQNQEIVITTSLDVLNQIRTMLPNGASARVSTRPVSLNLGLGIYVNLPSYNGEPPKFCATGKVLSMSDLNALLANDPNPFDWQPGYFGVPER
jgi:hypothetical protein